MAAPKSASKVVAPPEYGDAVESLRRMGARLEFNDDGNVTAVSLAHLDVGNEQLRHLETLTVITHLHLEGTQITNAGIAHLAGLSSLRLVNMGDTKVTRVGRQKLRGMLKHATVFPMDIGAVAETDDLFLRNKEKAVRQTRKRGKIPAFERGVYGKVAIVMMDGRVRVGWVVESTDDYVVVENADQTVKIRRSEIIDIIK